MKKEHRRKILEILGRTQDWDESAQGSFLSVLCSVSSKAFVGYLAVAKIRTAINQGFIAMKCSKRLSAEFVRRFVETTGLLFEKTTANIKESHTLTCLLDTLLPKLLSGELSVSATRSQSSEIPEC
ncbi:MAG: hypothetical protein M2R45_04059 [Verrucomicrobia subdivision 3 bacterium]|nr:hypothetical protein [Limisphaerales bacterium]MCS1416998.1 hypothetical protein [Limisphaerales bacterium]